MLSRHMHWETPSVPELIVRLLFVRLILRTDGHHRLLYPP